MHVVSLQVEELSRERVLREEKEKVACAGHIGIGSFT